MIICENLRNLRIASLYFFLKIDRIHSINNPSGRQKNDGINGNNGPGHKGHERPVCRFSTGREGKYLTSSLADEEYGVGILKIKEIIGTMPITTVPQTPEFVKGVINLRGKVVPVN